MKKITRILSMILALVLVLSMVACSKKEEKPVVDDPVDTPAVTDPVETPTEDPVVENPDGSIKKVSMVAMSMGEDMSDINSLSAFANEDGSIYVEYIGEEKKIGNLDVSVMDEISAVLATTDLESLNGADNYGDGEANGSMYIEFADGSAISVNYVGEIPAEFTDGYAKMEDVFKKITESLEVYVAKPSVMGDVDETILNEMMTILDSSNLENLDTIAIEGLDTSDEFFCEMAGVSNADGITAAAHAAPMMMSVAYSMVIVNLDGADAATVCEEFANNIDWTKWVCVAPSNVLIATKGNMVLCLQAADEMYTNNAAGVIASGWTQVNELSNPNT